jgi:hypothetical protein
MNLLATIKREQQRLEKQLSKLQNQLDGVKSAAKALGRSAGKELDRAGPRVLSAAARAKISRAAKRRWAKVRAGAKKAIS